VSAPGSRFELVVETPGQHLVTFMSAPRPCYFAGNFRVLPPMGTPARPYDWQLER
jgi:hypothetical protein